MTNLVEKKLAMLDEYVATDEGEEGIEEMIEEVIDMITEDRHYVFKTTPYLHQAVCFDKHCDDTFLALFADMGTGKSKMAIDITCYKYNMGLVNAVLVIAPNHVHAQWIREQFPAHCTVDYTSFLWDSAKVNTNYVQNKLEDFLIPPYPGKLKVLAVNVEALQSDTVVPYIRDFVQNNKVMTIIDEATRIKSPTAKRTKTALLLEKYGHRMILTGTPATKNPFSLWSMYEFLKKGFFDCNYFIFQARFGIMMKGTNQQTGRSYKTIIDIKMWNQCKYYLEKVHEQRGEGDLMPDDYLTVASITGLSEKNVRFIESEEDFVQYKRLDEIKNKIAPVTFFAKKADCLDLPDKIYDTLYVEMDKAHRSLYNKLKKELMVEYASQELTVLNKISLTTRLMQLSGGFFPYEEEHELANGDIVVNKKAMPIGVKNNKIAAIKDDLEELGDVFPIIIWAKFVAELKMIYESLKKDYRCCLYYGGTATNERHEIIEDFKAGKYDIFIGNPATAGFGLNLQNATYQYYYSNGFVVEERLQAEDRSHRIGVRSNCYYKDIVYKNTIDEKIVRAIKAGRDMNEYFKDSSIADLLSEVQDEE